MYFNSSQPKNLLVLFSETGSPVACYGPKHLILLDLSLSCWGYRIAPSPWAEYVGGGGIVSSLLPNKLIGL